jgi:hypothetical protein
MIWLTGRPIFCANEEQSFFVKSWKFPEKLGILASFFEALFGIQSILLYTLNVMYGSKADRLPPPFSSIV